ncbi:MAG: hypothetical protein LBR80_14870, partial [Deltaproteobacteria bacterium]|nr:hypothetical protein [Deltaproteobacteria bacterium]
MSLDEIKNRNGTSSWWIRESYREDGKVKKRAIQNVTAYTPEERRALLDIHRRRLNERSPLSSGLFNGPLEIIKSVPAGHVSAILKAMDLLGMKEIVCPKPCPSRDIVLGLLAARIIDPKSKLSTVDVWSGCSLG